jgi:hypothetical protein
LGIGFHTAALYSKTVSKPSRRNRNQRKFKRKQADLIQTLIQRAETAEEALHSSGQRLALPEKANIDFKLCRCRDFAKTGGTLAKPCVHCLNRFAHAQTQSDRLKEVQDIFEDTPQSESPGIGNKRPKLEPLPLPNIPKRKLDLES